MTSCYENLVIAYNSIINMAIASDHEPICRLSGADAENAKNVLDMIAKSMQLAATPEFPRTFEMYGQLTHEGIEHPLALKPRDCIRYQALRAIRDDLREHGTTYEAEVRECVALALNVPDAAIEARIEARMAEFTAETIQQFATGFAAKGVMSDLQRRKVTDREAYAPSMAIVQQSRDRIEQIIAEEERVLGYKNSLKRVAEFKHIVKGENLVQ